MNRIAAVIFSIVFGVILLAGGFGAFVYLSIHRSISTLNAIPLSPANYQPAVIELIKLCQSQPALYSDESVSYLDPFDPVWAPPAVAKLHPEGIQIEADHATVTWGGGFYHCGWELVRDAKPVAGSDYSWTLSFVSEDHPNQVLQTFRASADQRLSEDEFVTQVLAEFDRRLASHADDGMGTSEAGWYLAAARCKFLTVHHRANLLPPEVLKSAANYPHDWRDQLLGYFLEHRAGNPAAGAKLRQWADATGGPAAWMYIAYAFYRAGENDAGDAAMKKAAENHSSDPNWIDEDIPQVELGMAERLFNSRNYSTCAKYCDGILASPHRYFTTASSVHKVRDIAAMPTGARPEKLPDFDKFTSMDPFGGFDLRLLTSASSSSSGSSTQP